MTSQLGDANRTAGEVAERLGDWLTGNGVQSDSGAFCAWRDEDGLLAFEYPEITGYALTWLAGRPSLTAAGQEAGRRAARWLVERLAAGNRAAHDGWDEGAVYTFDLGMIAAGMISYGRRFDEAQTVERGELLAGELAKLALTNPFMPAVAPDGPPTGRPSSWSTAGRPHLAKCVQALMLIEEWDAAAHLIADACTFQDPSGYFLTQPDEQIVMLHPHFYTVEALWMWGTARGDDDALERAHRATEWAWRHQLPAGGLPRMVALDEDTVAPEQFDLTSQGVRAGLLTGAGLDRLEKAVSRLCTSALPLPDGAALPYQPQAESLHQNSWVSLFGAQALELAAQPGEVSLAWHELV